MIIVMSHQATPEQVDAVVARVNEIGLKADLSGGEERTVIGVIGGNAYAYREAFSHLAGIQEIIPITKPFKLASREFRPPNTVDVLQVGTRNMQNYTLLQEVGRSGRPVLLKRGMSSTIEEWLLAAEYVLSQGNRGVILCERGIRTFETSTRFSLDLNAVPLVRELSHLPVVVDPSQGTGRWSLVRPMSLAAVAAGAPGVIVEVHPKPDEALSDGAQSLDFEAFGRLMSDLTRLMAAMARTPA